MPAPPPEIQSIIDDVEDIVNHAGTIKAAACDVEQAGNDLIDELSQLQTVPNRNTNLTIGTTTKTWGAWYDQIDDDISATSTPRSAIIALAYTAKTKHPT